MSKCHFFNRSTIALRRVLYLNSKLLWVRISGTTQWLSKISDERAPRNILKINAGTAGSQILRRRCCAKTFVIFVCVTAFGATALISPLNPQSIIHRYTRTRSSIWIQDCHCLPDPKTAPNPYCIGFIIWGSTPPALARTKPVRTAAVLTLFLCPWCVAFSHCRTTSAKKPVPRVWSWSV